MQLAIYEILEQVQKAQTEEEKVAILRKHRSRTLVDILMGAFDKRIIWLLPEGPAPFKPNQGMDVEGALYHEARKMPYFVANAGQQYELSQNKREILYIQFLESIHPKDAALMVYVKDKKLPYPSITAELVFGKAFPDVNCLWDKESNIQTATPEAAKPAAGVITETPPIVKTKPKRKRTRAKKPATTTTTTKTKTKRKRPTSSRSRKKKTEATESK